MLTTYYYCILTIRLTFWLFFYYSLLLSFYADYLLLLYSDYSVTILYYWASMYSLLTTCYYCILTILLLFCYYSVTILYYWASMLTTCYYCIMTNWLFCYSTIHTTILLLFFTIELLCWLFCYYSAYFANILTTLLLWQYRKGSHPMSLTMSLKEERGAIPLVLKNQSWSRQNEILVIIQINLN